MRKKVDNQLEIQEEKKESLFKKLSRIWFIIFNLAYIIAYSVYTGYTLVNNNASMVWLPYILAVFILIYWVIFIVTLAKGSKHKLKSAKKDFKASFKILKQVLKLANLALTVTMITNTVLNDSKSWFAFILACVSIPYVVLQIIMSIVKFAKRKKKEKIKERKRQMKNEFVSDMKQMITDGKNDVFGNDEESLELLAESVADADDTDEEFVDDKKKSKKKSKVKQTIDKANLAIEHANKMNDRVKQYNEDRKNVGKKKSKKNNKEDK